MKIVADNKIPFLKGLLEPVAQEVDYVPGAQITAATVRDAQVLLTRTRTRCNSALLEGSQVQFIGSAAIGTDHIDLDYCRQHDITVATAPGCNAPAVAQWVHASILLWRRVRKISRTLTLGIVGAGHVGSIVAQWAQQLGYRVLLNDPPRAQREGEEAFVDLATVQRESDIITFHTPLTRDGEHPSWHLCDEHFLSHLQRCRLILNAARGAVCDTQALLQWHGDLAIDCWENEPNINRHLLDKAFIATPHIAGYSLQGKQRATAMIIEALNKHYDWDIKPQQASTPLKGAASVTAASIAASYDPLHDTSLLKLSPAAFETLRNTYPLRNEVDD